MAMLIPLTLTVPETGEELCPALLADGAHLVLVDCGYPESLPLIEAAMAELGLSPAELTEVFITHHDDDHMGGLAGAQIGLLAQTDRDQAEALFEVMLSVYNYGSPLNQALHAGMANPYSSDSIAALAASFA